MPLRPSAPKAALAATTALALVLAAGCTSSHGATGSHSSPATSPASSAASASSSVPPAPGSPTNAQLKAALISAGDLSFDRFSLNQTSPLSQDGAVGISAVFQNATQSRFLSVVLIHYATTTKAQLGVTGIQALAATQITIGAKNTKVTIGENGRLYQGANANGPVAILVFAEGKYDVTIQYLWQKPADLISASAITATGTKQDAKLKGLS